MVENESQEKGTASAHQVHVSQIPNVSSDIKISNDKTGSRMGKYSGVCIGNHYNDCQGCLHDCSILDCRLPGSEPPHTLVVQTQDVAHTSEHPGVESSGTCLNMCGKFHEYIHSTSKPMLEDPTPNNDITEVT